MQEVNTHMRTLVHDNHNIIYNKSEIREKSLHMVNVPVCHGHHTYMGPFSHYNHITTSMCVYYTIICTISFHFYNIIHIILGIGEKSIPLAGDLHVCDGYHSNQ